MGQCQLQPVNCAPEKKKKSKVSRIDLGLFSDKIYRAPAYIQLAALKKCNDNTIFLLGVTEEELSEFWSKASYHAIHFTRDRPEEKGRAVVNIDSRCHANTAEVKDPEKDLLDNFEIISKKDRSETKTKKYRLELSSSTTKAANFNLEFSGGGFFNTAAPVAPKGGIGGSYSKTDTSTWSTEQDKSESLAQGYEVVDTLQVPPKTKVKALITTWAVTYESKIITEISVDAKAELPIRYRTKFSRKLGGVLISHVKVTAKELFRGEWDYKCENEVVTFKRESKISHIGEEVEIIKQKSDCSLEEEMKISQPKPEPEDEHIVDQCY